MIETKAVNANLFLRLSLSEEKMLVVKSSDTKSSYGDLVEIDTKTNSVVVLDSSGTLSSAAYLPGTNNIIVYSYGSWSHSNSLPSDAGYYLFDPLSKEYTLLLNHVWEGGTEDMVNGFDVSPDGKYLLIPAISTSEYPFVIRFDINTRALDTLPVTFSSSVVRGSLWLRYSHDGTKLLYCHYPLGLLNGGGTVLGSESGIIDLKNYKMRVLQVYPELESAWISLFQHWSPDDTKIIYSSARVFDERPGLLSSFRICVLKLLN